MTAVEDLTRWHEVRVSLLLSLLLVAATLLGAASLLVIELPVWATLPAAFALVVAGVDSLRRHAWLRTPDACCSLRLVGMTKLEIRQRNGKSREYSIRAGTLIGPLIVLRLQATDRKKTPRKLVLMADALHPESRRRIRVWLNWRTLPQEADGSLTY